MGLWFAAPVGQALIFQAVRGESPRRAWGIAFVAYLMFFLPLLEWIRFLGVLPWILLSILQAALAALVGPMVAGILSRSERHVALRVAAVCGCLVLAEGVRGRLPFGGLTWGRLAFSQADGPLLSWASAGGAPLVSALVALLAALLLTAVERPRRARSLGSLATAVSLILLPAVAADGPGSRSVQVALVQGNVPRAGLDAFAEDLQVLRNHAEATSRLASEVASGQRARPDLVLWPENASDQDPRYEMESQQLLSRTIAELRQPILLGAVLRDPSGPSNGVVVWGDDGVTGPIYRKRHLVPFGEYLPLRRLVEGVYPAARQLLARDFVPGSQPGLLTLNGVPLAVATCFEVAFDDVPRTAVRAGGQLLVLPSNNASYGRSAQSAQQLAMARLRAVEHRRGTVVVTTSGISALITPSGEVVARSGLYEQAVLQEALPLRSDLTLATRWGPRIEMALAALATLALPGWLAFRVRRRYPRGV